MAKTKIILCDTNILFELFEDNPLMVDELNRIGYSRLAVSAVSVMETYYGMLEQEREETVAHLAKFDVYHITKDVSVLAMQLMNGFRQYHPGIADCLIAATAITNGLDLFTFNQKHFSYYKQEGLRFYKPKNGFRQLEGSAKKSGT
ncbi:MAG TPA: type II toxin-antitoxin system VapC family toxin [Cytophagales bacterium]|jgi:hypothetical protein